MLKSALFVLCSAVLVIALTGCDGGSSSGTSGATGPAPEMLPGVTPGQEPDPASIPTHERPGGNLGKTTSGEGK